MSVLLKWGRGALIRTVGERNMHEYAQPAIVFAGTVVRFTCYYHVFCQYIADITLCVGPSMLPTINENGDLFISESISRRIGNLEKGTVVVAASPRDPNGAICKRVLGLPGDRVCTNPSSFGPKKFKTIPKGHVWLQGDNLSNSTDSRTYGPVPLALIKSKLLMRIWGDGPRFVNHHYDPADWPAEGDSKNDIRSVTTTNPPPEPEPEPVTKPEPEPEPAGIIEPVQAPVDEVGSAVTPAAIQEAVAAAAALPAIPVPAPTSASPTTEPTLGEASVVVVDTTPLATPPVEAATTVSLPIGAIAAQVANTPKPVAATIVA